MTGGRPERGSEQGFGGEGMPTDPGAPARPNGPASFPRPLLVACVVIALQALALTAAAVFVVVDTVDSRPSSVARALLGAAFALAGAVIFGACARGLLHRRPAARTPIVVLEILCVPVAYSLAFQAGRVGYGGPIFVSALVVLYLLFTPPARAVLDRDLTR